VIEVGSNQMYKVLYEDGDKETIKEKELIDIIDEGGSGKMPASKRRKVSSSRRQDNYTSIYQSVPNNNKKTTVSVAAARKTNNKYKKSIGDCDGDRPDDEDYNTDTSSKTTPSIAKKKRKTSSTTSTSKKYVEAVGGFAAYSKTLPKTCVDTNCQHDECQQSPPPPKRKRNVVDRLLNGPEKKCIANGCETLVIGRGNVACGEHAHETYCSVYGCGNFAQSPAVKVLGIKVKGGVCIKHGAKKTCTHIECNNHVVRGGFCTRHGEKVTCSHEGCTNVVVNRGVCVKHGAVQKTCSHQGCTNKVKRGLGGFCISHGAKTCQREGCTNKAISYGVCQRHGKRGRPYINEGKRGDPPVMCLIADKESGLALKLCTTITYTNRKRQTNQKDMSLWGVLERLGSNIVEYTVDDIEANNNEAMYGLVNVFFFKRKEDVPKDIQWHPTPEKRLTELKDVAREKAKKGQSSMGGLRHITGYVAYLPNDNKDGPSGEPLTSFRIWGSKEGGVNYVYSRGGFGQMRDSKGKHAKAPGPEGMLFRNVFWISPCSEEERKKAKANEDVNTIKKIVYENFNAGKNQNDKKPAVWVPSQE